MICIKLPTICVVDKNNNTHEYAIENTINLEQINEYIKKAYGDNLKEVRLGTTIGYLRKESYTK